MEVTLRILKEMVEGKGKERFRGKSSFCNRTSVLRFAGSEMVITVIMWLVNVINTWSRDCRPSCQKTSRTSIHVHTTHIEQCAEPFWGGSAAFVFGW